MAMPKGKEITFYEREKIENWLRIKKKKTWIAKKLNRDYSVIKREIWFRQLDLAHFDIFIWPTPKSVF
jgi:IS30 family transposase